MVEERDRPGLGVALAAIGFVYGCTVEVLAIGLAGGGHGWCTPAGISIIGVGLVPMFGIALSSPRKKRRWTLWPVATAALVADLLLIMDAQNEGLSYVEKVWSRGAPYVVAWAVLWFAWQFALLGVLIRDIAVSWRE
jgi:hypothetical protein